MICRHEQLTFEGPTATPKPDALVIFGIIKAYHSLTLTVSIMNTYCTDKNLYLLCALSSLSHEHFCYRAVPKHIKFKA